LKISDKIIKRLNGVGYNLKNTIGHGEYGYIYDIGNNKALKITSDFSEAASVNKICNKQLKNVCRIYRVFRFEKVGEAKECLKKFRREFCEEYEKGSNKSDVYCFAMQFFKLTGGES
jgi:hypothetical protein